jgi:c-di-GMP-binding flagellar brake protein YcgR
MFIDEHATGTGINIRLADGKLDHDFVSEIIEGIYNKGKHYIFVKPIMGEDDKYINFARYPLVIEMVNTETGRVFRYSAKKHGYSKYKGELIFIISSDDDAKPINRREAYRVDICEQADVQVNGHTKVMPVFLHDISVTGISFVFPKDMEEINRMKVGDSVSITFTPSIYDRMIRVSAKICRFVDTTNDRILVGCRLNRFESSVASVVSKLSIMERKLASQNKNK